MAVFPNIFQQEKMKKVLFTTVATLLTLSSLKAQYTGQFDLGYSTQSTNLLPVFSFTLGRVFNAQDYHLAPMIEIGSVAHMDQQSDHNIYGHISGGLQLDNWLAFTSGFVYGGNQAKQDRHILADTALVLKQGATSEHYASYQLALRACETVMKTKDGLPFLQIVQQVTYAHEVWYLRAGVRFNLFD